MPSKSMYSFKELQDNLPVIVEDIRGSVARVISYDKGVLGPCGRQYDQIIDILRKQNGLQIVWWKSGQEIYNGVSAYIEVIRENLIDEVFIKLHADKVFAGKNETNYQRGVFILFTGIPGSGKTTLSKKIAERLNGIHFDFAREVNLIFNSWPHYVDEYISCSKIFNLYINQCLENGLLICYDTTAVTNKIRSFHFNSVSKGSKKVLIWKKVESEICRARLISERPFAGADLRKGIRKIDSRYVNTFDDFCDLFERPRECIEVTDDTSIDMLINRIKNNITKGKGL